MSEPISDDAWPLPLEEVIRVCEVRANHRGGASYDHVKASGMLPYLRALAAATGVVEAARRGELDENASEAAAMAFAADDVGWNGTGAHPWESWDESVRNDYRESARASVIAYFAAAFDATSATQSTPGADDA